MSSDATGGNRGDAELPLGIELSAQQQEQLRLYQEMVIHWNKTFNLVSRQDVGRFVPRHLADSLSILAYLAGEQTIDVGTGAGLPGIPLAIAAPERHMTLVERSAKKVRFLKQVIRRLALKNVRALNVDVQALAATPSEQGRYDRLVSRAVMPADTLWALAAPLLAPGGAMVLHAATQEAQPSSVATTQETSVAIADRGAAQPGTASSLDNAKPVALSASTRESFPGLGRLETHAQVIPGLQSTHQILVLYR